MYQLNRTNRFQKVRFCHAKEQVNPIKNSRRGASVHLQAGNTDVKCLLKASDEMMAWLKALHRQD